MEKGFALGSEAVRAGAPLTIRLLGELELRVDGRSLALPASKKSRALLGYLVATGRPHLRERLCDLLWQGPDDPRAALRWSLTKIRGLLDSGGVTRVVADRDRVAFEADGVECDLACVREASRRRRRQPRRPPLGAAAARFRGELLEGLDLPDCYRFHEWCTAEREAARALRVAVLAALVERLAGKPEEALAFARRRLAVDPLTEPAHVAVVSLLADLGRRREALEQDEACKRIFDASSGRPSPALLAARMRAVGSGAPPPETAPVARTAARPRTSDRAPSPLVGRDAERARCVEALASAAGQGADRASSCPASRASASRGCSTPSSTRPCAAAGASSGAAPSRRRWCGPTAPGSTPCGRRPPRSFAPLRADLAPLLPELGEAAAQDRERLFDAVVRLLVSLQGGGRRRARRPPVVDEASAALLHYAARAVAGKPVLIACGARAEELADNPSAVRLVRALQRESRVLEVELGPLLEAAVAELARSAHAEADVARIARESAGNPLFVLELARAAARERRRPTRSPASSQTASPASTPRRASSLPWAAAIGRTFAVETLERATELPVTELLTPLEELERRGILRETSMPWAAGYDFVHDLVRAAAYRGLSEPRRRLLHHRIARALEARAVTDGALHGDVAHHAAIAGDIGIAARAYLAAGLRCLRLFANDEAARLAEAGVAHAAQLGRAEAIPLTLALLKIKVHSGRWLQRARHDHRSRHRARSRTKRGDALLRRPSRRSRIPAVSRLCVAAQPRAAKPRPSTPRPIQSRLAEQAEHRRRAEGAPGSLHDDGAGADRPDDRRDPPLCGGWCRAWGHCRRASPRRDDGRQAREHCARRR